MFVSCPSTASSSRSSPCRADDDGVRALVRRVLDHREPVFGKPCPVTDLFGVAGPELLDRLEIPQPERGTVDASSALIDDLDVR